MRLLADENIPRASVERLRAAGHEVIAAAEELSGQADRELLRVAAEREALLITFDSAFGSLIFQEEAGPAPGVVLLRLVPRSPVEPAEVLLSVLKTLGSQVRNRFSVVDRERVRQRALPSS